MLLRQKLLKNITLFCSVLSLSLVTTNVFAANPYGIVYSGGVPLGEANVQIEPEMISGLTPLAGKGDSIVVSDTNAWKVGYLKSSSNCEQINYFRVWGNNIKSSNNIKLSYVNDSYTLEVRFVGSSTENLDGLSENGDAIAIYATSNGYISASSTIYSDSSCSVKAPGIVTFVGAPDYNEKVFIETDIKLYRNSNHNIVNSDQMYFQIYDIDASQSFKILNQDNLLTKNNMYAKSAADLQPDPASTDLKNMYLSNGNYIYSEPGFNTDNNDIYVKVGSGAQQNGLNFVFGYRGSGTGSRIQFLAKEYNIKYTSDDEGVVTGVTEEAVLSGNSPSGTTTKPKSKDLVLKHWISDHDVVLKDGSTIKVGQPILPEQLSQIVVDSDLVLTAIHGIPEKAGPAVPNTGNTTKEINGTVVSLSIIGVLAGALTIALLPRLCHKKLGFKK